MDYKQEFIFMLAKASAKLNRRLDSALGGLGMSEFIILYNLSQAEGQKMRRTDLAEKIGLTASGVTRLLLPMEKVGLVKREGDSEDGRVSMVQLASGGKRKLEEAGERMELFCEDAFPGEKSKKIQELSSLLKEISKNL